VIGRAGNPELANCELEAAFVNNEGSLWVLLDAPFGAGARCKSW